MILEFMNGSQLEVIDIYGGPKDTLGSTRDVLTIEISTSSTSFNELREFFMSNPNTNKLYTYVMEDDKEIKKTIGIGYNECISISNVRRLVKKTPGTISKPEIEELFIVEIAQQTYYEYILTHEDDE